MAGGLIDNSLQDANYSGECKIQAIAGFELESLNNRIISVLPRESHCK